MNLRIQLVCGLVLAGATSARGQAGYTNFVRQVQAVSGIEWDVQVAQTGEQLSPLSVDPGGAHFELWTVNSSPLQDYLLDQKFVGTYVPRASVRLHSEDPYPVITRTRADRPFYLDLTIDDLLLAAPGVPEAATRVTVSHFVQSYGAGGDGIGIDRSQATLRSQASMVMNGIYYYRYALTTVPGADRAKVRGEERFTVESLPDYQVAAAVLSSQFIQIWPVADGAISGISNGDFIRFTLPPIEIQLNDLYPDSETWAHVYQGNPQLGMTGTIVPGSAVVVADSVPQSRVLRINDWDSVFSDDGRWTLEVVTKTPFGLDRLDYVSFDINRTLQVNGSVTTIE
jgi:hypothetical protein